MKIWLKGGLIGLGIWIFLILLFLLGQYIGENPCDSENTLVGVSCYTPFQEITILIIGLIGFLSFVFGGSPVMSSFGPQGVFMFYFGSALTFFLWGCLIGFIVQRVRRK
jgi:hypothetical protein